MKKVLSDDTPTPWVFSPQRVRKRLSRLGIAFSEGPKSVQEYEKKGDRAVASGEGRVGETLERTPPLGDGECAQAIDREGFTGGVMVTDVSGLCAVCT